MISDFEQKKKLQKRLHALREECERRDVDFLSKLNEFLDRAMVSKKDYAVWEGIVADILENLQLSKT